MKTNRKSTILLFVLLILILREIGSINFNYCKLHSIHNTGIGTLIDGNYVKKSYAIDLIWKGEKETETGNPNTILIKEISREGFGWKTYIPLKKETHASFKFIFFEKKGNKYLGNLEVHNDYSMTGISSGYYFKERIKAHTKKRVLKYLYEKTNYIDSKQKKDESSWMKCPEEYSFNTKKWDMFSNRKMERIICISDIDSIQTDTFFFSSHQSDYLEKLYAFEVVNIQIDEEEVLFEVKRFYNNGQLAFHGFFKEETQEKPKRFSYYTIYMDPTGIWRSWDHNGELQKSWDFDRMGLSSDLWK